MVDEHSFKSLRMLLNFSPPEFSRVGTRQNANVMPMLLTFDIFSLLWFSRYESGSHKFKLNCHVFVWAATEKTTATKIFR